MKESFYTVKAHHPLQCFEKRPPNPKRFVFLLHGFGESGDIILQRLGNLFDDQTWLMAPSGPFWMPQKKEKGYTVTHAWYLFDSTTNRYVIDHSFASEVLQNLYLSFDIKLPVTIIGYSQGGYLAPFAGLAIPHCQHVIGLSCHFRAELLPEKLPFYLDALHGDHDLMVDMPRSRESFHKLEPRTKGGHYIVLEGEGHRLTQTFKDKLKNLL